MFDTSFHLLLVVDMVGDEISDGSEIMSLIYVGIDTKQQLGGKKESFNLENSAIFLEGRKQT